MALNKSALNKLRNAKIPEWGENALKNGVTTLWKAYSNLLAVMANEVQNGTVTVQLLDSAVYIKGTGGRFNTPPQELLTTSPIAGDVLSSLAFLNPEGMTEFSFLEKADNEEAYFEYSVQENGYIKMEMDDDLTTAGEAFSDRFCTYSKAIKVMLYPLNMPGCPWDSEEKAKQDHDSILEEIVYAIKTTCRAIEEDPNCDWELTINLDDCSYIGLKEKDEQ